MTHDGGARADADPQSRIVGGTPSGERTTSARAVIRVRGLEMHYDGVEAVRGVDLDVREGEIVAVVGPNGAGKTTTLEILEGLRSRTGGEVTVLGEDPERAGDSWRARIGVVLQFSEPERHLTVAQCLKLYAGYYPHPRSVEETLALVGLSDRAHVLGGRLSGGQRRRMDVALALIGDPELIFLDEPTSGFDPSARRAAWSTIAGLRELGKTFVLTTHQMEEAEVLADRIAVLVAGRIAADGTPGTLGGRDQAPFTITFTLQAGVEVADLREAFSGRLMREDARLKILSIAPLDDLELLRHWARGVGHAVDDLRVQRPTLEDIYFELTGEAQ